MRLTRISALHEDVCLRIPAVHRRAILSATWLLKQRLRRLPVANPKLEVLTPQNSQMIFIDHQPQMAFGVQSIDRQTLRNNVVSLAKAAKLFNIPTTITTVETHAIAFAGRASRHATTNTDYLFDEPRKPVVAHSLASSSY
jgi:hypothetical protein